ncbi:hypothetical protein [Methanosarcina sp.]|uniref:hypothetical protein n=1 Tax=Methanosarcina sp. TaxID=2213 RepID=UPI003C730EBF
MYIIITVSCPGILILKNESSTPVDFKEIGTPIENPIGVQIESQIKNLIEDRIVN